MEISKTDLQTAIAYLADAAKLYEALAVPPVQKYASRAHMLRRLVEKLKRTAAGQKTMKPKQPQTI